MSREKGLVKPAMARDKIANNTIDFVQAAAKEGLRIDGRRPNDMRALDFKLGPKVSEGPKQIPTATTL